jgi:hypothetical protein
MLSSSHVDYSGMPRHSKKRAYRVNLTEGLLKRAKPYRNSTIKEENNALVST